MIFYTYVLKSHRDQRLYVGWTSDLKRRLKKHQGGQVEATRNRRPFSLVYFEACGKKDKAIAREKYFKTGFGRRYLKDRI